MPVVTNRVAGSVVSATDVNGIASLLNTVEATANGKADDASVVKLTGNQVIAGTKQFSASPVVPDGSFTIAKIAASGTRDGTTFLRGDGIFAVPAGGGTGSASDASTTTKGIIQLAGDLSGTAAAPTVPGLANKANTSDVVTLAGAQTITGAKTFNAAPTVPDNSFTAAKISATGTRDTTTFLRGDGTFAVPASGGTPADATTTTKGVIILAGDLAGTAAAPTVPSAVKTSGAQTIAGVKTFSSAPVVPDSSFALSKISATGTRDATTFLRGDGTFAAPSGSGGGSLMPDETDVLIYRSGSTYYALNGITGASITSGTDPGAVLQTAINGLGAAGGLISFQPDTYVWASIPKLPVNLTGWLRIHGNGSTITLGSASGERFLDLDGTSVFNDTFRRIAVDGFTIDAVNLGPTAATAGTVAVGISNYGMAGGERRNVEDLRITNLRFLNVPSAASTRLFLVIYIHIAQSATGQSNTYKRVLVENIDIQGGMQGVSLVGAKTGGYTGAVNVVMDEITVRNIRHDCIGAPTAFGSGSHIHIASFAVAHNVLVENIIGYGSRDVGIEIDSTYNAIVRDVYLENCFGYGIALANFLHLPDHYRQTTNISNVMEVRNAGRLSQYSTGLIGLVNDAQSTPANPPYGRIKASNCHFHRLAGAPTLSTDPIDGELMKLGGDFISAELSSSSYSARGQANNSAGGIGPGIIVAQDLVGTGTKKITLRDIDIHIQGSDSSTGGTEWHAARLHSSIIDLLVDNMYVDYNWSPSVAGSQVRGIFLGNTATTTTMKGTIKGLRVGGAGLPIPRGVMIPAVANLTLQPAIRIVECDFRQITPGEDIFFFEAAGTGNNTATKVVRRENWNTTS